MEGLGASGFFVYGCNLNKHGCLHVPVLSSGCPDLGGGPGQPAAGSALRPVLLQRRVQVFKLQRLEFDSAGSPARC